MPDCANLIQSIDQLKQGCVPFLKSMHFMHYALWIFIRVTIPICKLHNERKTEQRYLLNCNTENTVWQAFACILLKLVDKPLDINEKIFCVVNAPKRSKEYLRNCISFMIRHDTHRYDTICLDRQQNFKHSGNKLVRYCKENLERRGQIQHLSP